MEITRENGCCYYGNYHLFVHCYCKRYGGVMHLESVNLPQQGSFFGWGLTCEVNLMEKNDGM